MKINKLKPHNMSQKPLPKRILKWVIGVPVVAVISLALVGWLSQSFDPEGTMQRKLARQKEEYRDSVAQHQEDFKDSVSLSNEEHQRVTNEAIIKEAKVYSWIELPADIKAKVHDYNSYYTRGWGTNNSSQFNKKDSYYVKAIIGNKQLAELSQSKGFEPEKVLAEKPIYLYGKYKNRWTFQDQQSEINETSKFDGFHTIQVDRSLDKDVVWIGPIPEKPTQMTILGRGDNSETKPIYRF